MIEAVWKTRELAAAVFGEIEDTSAQRDPGIQHCQRSPVWRPASSGRKMIDPLFSPVDKMPLVEIIKGEDF